MARNQLDFRQKYVHETENGSSLIPAAGPPSSCFAGAGAAGAGAAAAEAATMDSETIFRPPVAKNASSTRDRSSRAFGTRGEDLVMAEASVVPMPPGQDTRKPRREWGNHSAKANVSGGFGEVATGISTTSHTREHESVGGAATSSAWNNSMSLSHRRCNSAPNISSISSSSWRGAAGLPCPSSGTVAPDLRDHTIPEGRRFEALEPPLQPTIAPGRPRSWRARTTAPPWGTGPASAVDFKKRDPSSCAMDWVPKLRASYFVNVRGQGEAPANKSAAGLVSKSLAIGGVAAANSRPFEEIKRMRLSQALESSGATHFDAARLTPRFSAGKGINVSGFSSALNCRPPAFGSVSGLTFGPLSPALTEPPTPPSVWKMQEPEAFGSNGSGAIGSNGSSAFCSNGSSALGSNGSSVFGSNGSSAFGSNGSSAFGSNGSSAFGSTGSSAFGSTGSSAFGSNGSSAFGSNGSSAFGSTGSGGLVQQASKMVMADSEQGVLPMAQRPMDEVNAVQALMSVGLGTKVGLGTMAHSEARPKVEAAAVETSEAGPNPVPSLERLKPFEGGGDDDDDGLDKDLWVVVEKGSLCAAADCVYRDAAARIASRRHYHSKCTHTHNGGEKKGMVFHHHQLEKVQKHQRSHKREATKSAPYKRTTPEDHQAMEGAGVEGYRPADWSPEETRQLDELVNQLVAPVTHAWPSIARFFPTKTGIQCLLHWRFTLNDNGIIRGNGTWGAEEDERLRKLAPVFSSPSTGPRWAKIAEVMPGRTAKQCRERYNNHVDPAIKKDKIWSAEEDALVMQLHAEHHNQFAKIARSIPGRCYDDVKNRFNLLVKRRQLVGKSANSGIPNPGSRVSSRPTAERSGTTERRVPPPFEGTATAGLFRNPSVAEQSLLASKGGVKRSTPETLGR